MKLNLSVRPGTSREKLLKNLDNTYTAYLTKRPRKGEANRALIELLAKQFSVPKSKIKIMRGEKSRNKIVEIDRGRR